MALLAAAKLSDEMMRLVWRTGPTAAIDLGLRHAEVHRWFAGVPVYRTSSAAAYPPATYATLWPFLGWLSLGPARWLWGATTVVALVAMAWVAVRESGASGGWQRSAAALIALAMNQTGVAVGNGQLILHVLPPLVIGLLLIQRGSASWMEDLVAAACVVFAMVKVTLAVPFLWLVFFAPSPGGGDRGWPFRLRPALLVAAGYIGLTIFAASFQADSLWVQFRAWLSVARGVAEGGGDYANVSAWLGRAELAWLALPVATAVFAALGVWLYRRREAELWVRLGVVALVTRFWMYHRLYDDVLVLLAFVALFRIATSSAPGAPVGPRVRAAATASIATSMVFMLLPARLGTAPSPWHQIFDVSHATTWLGMLGFLGWVASATVPITGRAPARGGIFAA
jgi:hypothetical protein